MTAQNVQRSVCQREPKYETAWAILVLGIVIDQMSVGKCLSDFLDTDSPADALINRVLRELEPPSCYFALQVFDHGYSGAQCRSPVLIIAQERTESKTLG